MLVLNGEHAQNMSIAQNRNLENIVCVPRDRPGYVGYVYGREGGCKLSLDRTTGFYWTGLLDSFDSKILNT